LPVDFFGLLVLLLLALIFLPLIAIASNSALKQRVNELEREVIQLRVAVADRGAAPMERVSAPSIAAPAPSAPLTQPPPRKAAPLAPPAPLTPPEAHVPQPLAFERPAYDAPVPEEPGLAAPNRESATSEPAAPEPLAPAEHGGQHAAPSISASDRPAPVRAAAAGATARESFEQRLTERWAVWLGAVALALGGIFLVRSAIDAGLLGPAVRVGFGFTLGVALAVCGEAMRQRWLMAPALAPLAEGFVPAAMSAAGVVIAFASVFAGYALHDLLPPLVAFALLALVSLAAVALSLLQGPMIALLGLVGAYAVPLLVGSRSDGPHGLFLYMARVIHNAASSPNPAWPDQASHHHWRWRTTAKHAAVTGGTPATARISASTCSSTRRSSHGSRRRRASIRRCALAGRWRRRPASPCRRTSWRCGAG